jgi:hypothetical protein
MLYGVSAYIYYVAWDTAGNVGKVADEANHTLEWHKDDGTKGAPTNSPEDADYGLYRVQLTEAETQTFVGAVSGMSTTSNVEIIPQVYTFTNRPVDGITDEKFRQVVLAVFAGKATVSSDGRTVSYKKQDGTTEIVSITVSATPGERTSSNIT